MLCREIIAVCFEIQTQHINTLRGQNVEQFNTECVVFTVTTRTYRVKATPRILNAKILLGSFKMFLESLYFLEMHNG